MNAKEMFEKKSKEFWDQEADRKELLPEEIVLSDSIIFAACIIAEAIRDLKEKP